MSNKNRNPKKEKIDETKIESEPILVGRAKGPGDSTIEFKFVTPDKDRVKIGEFIYYIYTDEKNIEHKVLSRVINRIPLRLYPDIMLSNPVLDPAEIANTINYSNNDMDYYLIDSQIIGFFKDQAFKFVNPRIPPKPGQPIYLADAKDLEYWINSVNPNDMGGALMGQLLSRPYEGIEIGVNVNSICETHLAVLAATGSGKSYTVGVLLEEILKAKNRGAVLVFDPHDEYKTLLEMETNDQFTDGTYSPQVQLKDPNDVHIKFSSLKFTEIVRLLKDITDKMTSFLRMAYNKVIEKDSSNFTIETLKEELVKLKDKTNESTIEGIKWRLEEFIGSREIISDVQHNSLRELLTPGKITVLNLSSLVEEDQELTTSVLLDRILKSRIRYERASLSSGKENAIDLDKDKDILNFPVFIVLEEGHKFAPANRPALSKPILKTILSEGRKFGVGVCIVSQRPGKLDSDVLSQCMTQIIMKIINPVDQNNIKDSVESVSEDLIRELPGLTKGQAIVTGEAINTPVLIQIRERITKHGGSSPNAVKSWREYKPPTVSKVKFDDDDEPLD